MWNHSMRIVLKCVNYIDDIRCLYYSVYGIVSIYIYIIYSLFTCYFGIVLFLKSRDIGELCIAQGPCLTRAWPYCHACRI